MLIMYIVHKEGEKHMPYNEKKRASNERWNKENMEKLGLNLPKGTKEILKQLSILEGMSTTKYLIYCVAQHVRNAGDIEAQEIAKGLPWQESNQDNQDSTRQPGENIDSV